MSSAVCFNLDQSNILSSGNGVILEVTENHEGNDSDRTTFQNVVGKGKKCSFLLFL